MLLSPVCIIVAAALRLVVIEKEVGTYRFMDVPGY
jgi:hypothetical protein